MRTGAIICDPWWQSTELWLALLASLSGLVGVVLGVLLVHWRESRHRRRRSGAHWAALRAEIEFCCGRAETFLGADIGAPLYRLPTIVYLHSFPALLADGVPTEPDTRSLIQFYSEVETLNRGLDLAQAARDRKDEQARLAEHERNRLKATRLVQDHCPEARAVVNRHLQ